MNAALVIVTGKPPTRSVQTPPARDNRLQCYGSAGHDSVHRRGDDGEHVDRGDSVVVYRERKGENAHFHI